MNRKVCYETLYELICTNLQFFQKNDRLALCFRGFISEMAPLRFPRISSKTHPEPFGHSLIYGEFSGPAQQSTFHSQSFQVHS